MKISGVEARCKDGEARPPLTFALVQPWRDRTEAGFRDGRVRLAWEESWLTVTATLLDDEIFNTATQDNDRLWRTGDTFEIFLQAEGGSHYAELHISPNNHRLHLRIPLRKNSLGEAAMDPDPSFASKLVAPIGFQSKVRRRENAWRVFARIPPQTLGLEHFEAAQCLLVSFARYDAAKDRPPILSTTSPHPIPLFHRREDWTRLILTEHDGALHASSPSPRWTRSPVVPFGRDLKGEGHFG